jgi:hypothetical protein
LVFEIIRREDVGSGEHDDLLIVSIEQSSLFLKCDTDAKRGIRGAQSLAIAATVRDLYDVGSGFRSSFCIMGPTYRRSQQLMGHSECSLDG